MLGHPVHSEKVRFYIWKRRYFLNLKKVRKTGQDLIPNHERKRDPCLWQASAISQGYDGIAGLGEV